jgi:hypothetical protein
MKKKIKISEIDLFDFLIKFWKCKFQVLLILLSSITLSYMTSTQIPKEFKVSTVIPSVQMIKVRLLNDVIDESIVVNFRNLVSLIISDTSYSENYIDNHPYIVELNKNGKKINYRISLNQNDSKNKGVVTISNLSNKNQSIKFKKILEDYFDEVFSKAVSVSVQLQKTKFKETIRTLEEDLEIAKALNIVKDVAVDFDPKHFKERNVVINFTNLQGYYKGTMVLQQQIKHLEDRHNLKLEKIKNRNLYLQNAFFEKIEISSQSIFDFRSILLLFITIGIFFSVVFVVYQAKKN